MDWTWLYVIVGTGASALLNFLVLYFWKPWAQAYAGEKAKNVARKEDLDKILLEVRAVTAATESIKADINGGLWERQMCWNQKRDLYAELMKKTHELLNCNTNLRVAIAGSRALSGELARVEQARRDLHSLVGMSFIFANTQCMNALREYFLDFERVSSGAEDNALAEQQRTATLQGKLIAAARTDLGLEIE
jgi:hypothetical protein